MDSGAWKPEGFSQVAEGTTGYVGCLDTDGLQAWEDNVSGSVPDLEWEGTLGRQRNPLFSCLRFFIILRIG